MMFESEFCKIKYLQDINAVLCSWKKRCSFDGYRDPLKYGLNLINENNATIWITDTTNGFENTKEDNQWLATEFIPQAINSSCKCIIFVVRNDSPLKSEIDLQSQLLRQFFEVKLVERLEDAWRA